MSIKSFCDICGVEDGEDPSAAFVAVSFRACGYYASYDLCAKCAMKTEKRIKKDKSY